jgi:hypothetical protein
VSLDQERFRVRRFGFYSLTFWMGLGLLLETAHALKLSAYLDHPLRRELLLWAHAHGVGLSLVVLAYAALGVSAEALPAGKALRAGSVLMPLGFALGVLGHGEADPGPSVWLVPVGALLSLYALINIARHLPRP